MTSWLSLPLTTMKTLRCSPKPFSPNTVFFFSRPRTIQNFQWKTYTLLRRFPKKLVKIINNIYVICFSSSFLSLIFPCNSGLQGFLCCLWQLPTASFISFFSCQCLCKGLFRESFEDKFCFYTKIPLRSSIVSWPTVVCFSCCCFFFMLFFFFFE